MDDVNRSCDPIFSKSNVSFPKPFYTSISLPVFIRIESEETPFHECYYVTIEPGLELKQMIHMSTSLNGSNILVPIPSVNTGPNNIFLSDDEWSSDSELDILNEKYNNMYSSSMLDSLSISDSGAEIGIVCGIGSDEKKTK